MNNFTFYNPVKILFGKGQTKNIIHEIPKDSRVLIVYGGGSIKRNGVYDEVIAALKGHTVFEFGGVEPNPHYETLMKAVKLAREENIDFLLAVGGGSVADGVKFIAAAIHYKGNDPWDIVAKCNMASPAAVPNTVPFGVVLTLPATGSEMNMGSVITRYETGDKLAFQNPNGFPKFSVLDPAHTFSLPKHQTANGIIDAFVHVTEQYLTYPVNAPLQDRFAEGILLTLMENAEAVIQNTEDYEARANVMFSATMALNGLIGVGVPTDWATHFLGHEITAAHGVDHGQTLAIVLPTLLSVKRAQKEAKLLQYADRVWGIREGDTHQRIEKAIAKTRAFFESLGVKTRLSDYGIAKKDIAKMVSKLAEHGRMPVGEHGDITTEVAEEIYIKSL